MKREDADLEKLYKKLEKARTEYQKARIAYEKSYEIVLKNGRLEKDRICERCGRKL